MAFLVSGERVIVTDSWDDNRVSASAQFNVRVSGALPGPGSLQLLNTSPYKISRLTSTFISCQDYYDLYFLVIVLLE